MAHEAERHPASLRHTGSKDKTGKLYEVHYHHLLKTSAEQVMADMTASIDARL